MSLLMLLLFCAVSSAVKHSLTCMVIGSSGLPNISEFVRVTVVDGINVDYCDSSNKRIEPRQDWMKNMIDDNPVILKWHTQQCFETVPNFFRAWIRSLKQQFNQNGGVHILQMIEGCEWDENTGEVTGFLRFGYNREDFLEFDLKTLTWIALKPEADIIKQRWDAERSRNNRNHYFLTTIYPDWLNMSLYYGKSSLQRTALPSVSLLQKSPSSPISCHATGFYPHRAVMFWRKDGEEIHEDMDPGEILPNHDGTFQISADLNVSSVTPEDWSRYECVFQLSEDAIITKLNETVIRTNQRVLPSVSLLQKSPSSPISCHAAGFYPHRAVMFWRKDGEEIHEGVDPGEILPNHDGTFQMSVDLKLSSVTPADWSRYECVFELSEDAIITKLNETVIRTNRREKSLNAFIPIIAVLLVLILFAADGFNVYKKKGKHFAPSSGNTSETDSERLTGDAT
ncbi:major histocompatibility complex class I-related gene protein-like [Archocentrus centrarchus]|uniref:major histocompatibility complex class I-related gene protein-like n=1 Tax=Archocentrus centrarchus TaxID=63155 RepID=UPI0011EA43AE|nr:major histocompatibility complex class I-related gene protein-like [Archocentrus centrarchus]